MRAIPDATDRDAVARCMSEHRDIESMSDAIQETLTRAIARLDAENLNFSEIGRRLGMHYASVGRRAHRLRRKRRWAGHVRPPHPAVKPRTGGRP